MTKHAKIFIFSLLFITKISLALSAVKPGSLEEATHASTSNAQIQKEFKRAIILLHNFEYEDAREIFQHIEAQEPHFFLAFWGEAMTYNHPVWGDENVRFASKILNKLGRDPVERIKFAKTEIERDHWQAIEILYGKGTKIQRDFAYSKKMAEISAKYPTDLDAKAFYALSLLGSTGGERVTQTYMKAAALAQEILNVNPRHPGALHYLIHSVDDPKHAAMGLSAAKAYGILMKDSEHAAHMPAHIYAPLGIWQNVIIANEKSWHINDEQAKAKNRIPGIGKFHALLWLHYAYLQVGRYQDANRVIHEMTRNIKYHRTPKTLAFLSQMQAIDTLDNPISSKGYLEIDIANLEVAYGVCDLFRKAWDAVEEKNWMQASYYQKRIEAKIKSVFVKHHARGGCSCGGSNLIPETRSLMQSADIMRDQLRARILLEQGRTEEAIKILQATTSKSDAMPYMDGPPMPVKPAHELLGDIMFQLGRYTEAKREYEASLKHHVNRTRSLYGAYNASVKLNDTKSGKQFLKEVNNNLKLNAQ